MKRLSEWIQALAVKSGHPDMVSALFAVFVAALTVSILRNLFGPSGP
jgi:hypothetical protein